MMKTRSSAIRLAVSVAAVLALTLVPAVVKAIYVSPHAVFIDHATRTGQVTLGNATESTEEVTVELRFGFPDTDSAGTPFIRFIDDPGPEFPSAADWIRPFPRRVRLEPETQQVVRLLATPPDDLPDGEYWTRMIVTARGAAISIATGDTAVSAGVSLEVRMITSIAYRKGDVHTGITLREYTASVDGDSLVAWVSASREGNAAYLGTAEFDLLDAERQSILEWSTPVAVYYPMNRRFAFPIHGLEPGSYELRLSLTTDRPDLLEEQVLPAETVSDSLQVVIP